jgi:hypothetical protein
MRRGDPEAKRLNVRARPKRCDGRHVVSEITNPENGQASKNNVRTNDIVVLVNDEAISAAMSHDELIELLFSQTKVITRISVWPPSTRPRPLLWLALFQPRVSPPLPVDTPAEEETMLLK